MKRSETHERRIFLMLEPHEIDQLVLDSISKQIGVGLKQPGVTFEIQYEFIKEGSPEYNTRKIKASVRVVHDMMPQPASESPVRFAK